MSFAHPTTAMFEMRTQMQRSLSRLQKDLLAARPKSQPHFADAILNVLDNLDDPHWVCLILRDGRR